MTRFSMALILASISVFSSVAARAESADGNNGGGKKVQAADADDVREEIEEQKRHERELQKKAIEAQKREAERLKEAEARRKYQQALSAANSANVRYEEVLAKKKTLDGAVSAAQHEVEYFDKKIANLNAKIQELKNSPGGLKSQSGTSINFDFSAEIKVLQDKIQAEQKKRLAAVPLIEKAKSQAQAYNSEFNNALQAKRRLDSELSALKPAEMASAKPAVKVRHIVTLIDGREFTTVMLNQSADEVNFFTDEGKQYKFPRKEVTNIRKEGEDKPE